jgi:hypothetical protein
MKPNDRLPTWPALSADCRVWTCCNFLASHGFLSPSESRRVRDRVEKWIKNSKGAGPTKTEKGKP